MSKRKRIAKSPVNVGLHAEIADNKRARFNHMLQSYAKDRNIPFSDAKKHLKSSLIFK